MNVLPSKWCAIVTDWFTINPSFNQNITTSHDWKSPQPSTTIHNHFCLCKVVMWPTFLWNASCTRCRLQFKDGGHEFVNFFHTLTVKKFKGLLTILWPMYMQRHIHGLFKALPISKYTLWLHIQQYYSKLLTDICSHWDSFSHSLQWTL